MRVVRYVVLGVLLAGLVITSVGWYRAADAGTERTFDSCRFDGDTLVLSYMYGVNEIVSPSLDTTGADIVVALRVKQGWAGSHPQRQMRASVAALNAA